MSTVACEGRTETLSGHETERVISILVLPALLLATHTYFPESSGCTCRRDRQWPSATIFTLSSGVIGRS